MRIAKSNHAIKVASQTNMNLKDFFQVYRKKTRNKLDPLKIFDVELISSWEGIRKILNSYFLTIFTQENMKDIPDSRQIFRVD